jgi:hypothetical protein
MRTHTCAAALLYSYGDAERWRRQLEAEAALIMADMPPSLASGSAAGACAPVCACVSGGVFWCAPACGCRLHMCPQLCSLAGEPGCVRSCSLPATYELLPACCGVCLAHHNPPPPPGGPARRSGSVQQFCHQQQQQLHHRQHFSATLDIDSAAYLRSVGWDGRWRAGAGAGACARLCAW